MRLRALPWTSLCIRCQQKAEEDQDNSRLNAGPSPVNRLKRNLDSVHWRP